jgi:hypothetical protein
MVRKSLHHFKFAQRTDGRSRAIEFAILIIVSSLSLPIPSAQAETCRKRSVNGEQVVICCDGNGVCYRK